MLTRPSGLPTDLLSTLLQIVTVRLDVACLFGFVLFFLSSCACDQILGNAETSVLRSTVAVVREGCLRLARKNKKTKNKLDT